jgi:hypothetical protein
MICPRCKNNNRPGAKFCGYCDMPLAVLVPPKKLSPAAALLQLLDAFGWFGYAVMDCPRCGNKNRLEARFCGYCGGPVEAVFAINKPGLIALVLLLLGVFGWVSHSAFMKDLPLNPPPAAAAAPTPAGTSQQKPPDEHLNRREALMSEANWQKAVSGREAVEAQIRREAEDARIRREAEDARIRREAEEAQIRREAEADRVRREAAAAKAQAERKTAEDNVKAAHDSIEAQVNAAREAAMKSVEQHR